jgi:hypothetical protein
MGDWESAIGHTWRESKIVLRYCSSKETGCGFGARYSSVGFAVVRLLEGVIKGRGGGKYMHRKLMKVLKLLLWVADHCDVVRRERRRGRKRRRRRRRRRRRAIR